MNLLDELNGLARFVEDRSGRWHEPNEGETARLLILRFIEALGYDTENPREVKEQFKVGNRYVDFAIKLNGQPIVLLEAKQATKGLSDWWVQLNDYFGDSSAKFAILTNGREYRFYTDLHTVASMDKHPFLNFDLRLDFRTFDEHDRKLAEDLEWFKKGMFNSHRVLAMARRRTLVPILKRELRRPSRDLTLFFAKQVTSIELTESDVIQNYSEALSEAWRELKKLDHSESRKLATDVVNVELTAEYKGRRFTATLLLTETLQRTGNNVVFEDVEMNYQEATDQAINMVHSSESFISGWEFWRFIDPDTIEELPLKRLFFDAEIRTRVRNRKYRR